MSVVECLKTGEERRGEEKRERKKDSELRKNLPFESPKQLL